MTPRALIRLASAGSAATASRNSASACANLPARCRAAACLKAVRDDRAGAAAAPLVTSGSALGGASGMVGATLGMPRRRDCALQGRIVWHLRRLGRVEARMGGRVGRHGGD